MVYDGTRGLYTETSLANRKESRPTFHAARLSSDVAEL